MKCLKCGNDRTEEFCSYCNWKGDEGPGAELRDLLTKEKPSKSMTRGEFIIWVYDNFKVYHSDVEKALNEEIDFVKENPYFYSPNGVVKTRMTLSEIEFKAVEMCLYWANMPRIPINPDRLFSHRKSALYFQSIFRKN